MTVLYQRLNFVIDSSPHWRAMRSANRMRY